MKDIQSNTPNKKQTFIDIYNTYIQIYVGVKINNI